MATSVVDKNGKQADVQSPKYSNAAEVMQGLMAGKLTQQDASALIEELMAEEAKRKASGGGAKHKTVCQVTREEFLAGAGPVEVTINGQHFVAEAKEFSTGSLGWYLTGKLSTKVGDKTCMVQMGLNLTVVGSKELPR